MLFLIPLALANPEDPEKLKAISAQLDEVDERIARANAWIAAGVSDADALAQADGLKNALREDAGEARKINGALIALKGRLSAGPKEEQAFVPEAEALMERIKGQNNGRMVAVNLLDAGLALPKVEAGDVTAFATVNNALFAALQNAPADADIDAWMKRPIEAALEKQRWDMTFSWATFCSQACTDKALPTRALEAVPEKHGKDARWLTLADKRAAKPPAVPPG